MHGSDLAGSAGGESRMQLSGSVQPCTVGSYSVLLLRVEAGGFDVPLNVCMSRLQRNCS